MATMVMMRLMMMLTFRMVMMIMMIMMDSWVACRATKTMLIRKKKAGLEKFCQTRIIEIRTTIIIELEIRSSKGQDKQNFPFSFSLPVFLSALLTEHPPPPPPPTPLPPFSPQTYAFYHPIFEY